MDLYVKVENVNVVLGQQWARTYLSALEPKTNLEFAACHWEGGSLKGKNMGCLRHKIKNWRQFYNAPLGGMGVG